MVVLGSLGFRKFKKFYMNSLVSERSVSFERGSNPTVKQSSILTKLSSIFLSSAISTNKYIGIFLVKPYLMNFSTSSFDLFPLYSISTANSNTLYTSLNSRFFPFAYSVVLYYSYILDTSFLSSSSLSKSVVFTGLMLIIADSSSVFK